MRTHALTVGIVVGAGFLAMHGTSEPPSAPSIPTDPVEREKWLIETNARAGQLADQIRGMQLDHAEDILRASREPKDMPGRYQIVLGTLTGKQTYLIDTSTGRTWELLNLIDRDGKVEETAWQELRRYGPRQLKGAP